MVRLAALGVSLPVKQRVYDVREGKYGAYTKAVRGDVGREQEQETARADN